MKFSIEKKVFIPFTLTIESELEALLLVGAFFRTSVNQHAEDTNTDQNCYSLVESIVTMSVIMNSITEHIGKPGWRPHTP